MNLYLQIMAVSLFLTIPTMLTTAIVIMLFKVCNDRENIKRFK